MTLFDSIPLDANSRLSRLTVSILLLLIVIAGLILRLHLLTRRDLWDDEAASVIFAQLPWSSFLKTMWNYEANMSFYYLLLRGWLHFGHSEGMIRSLSVLFGVALLPATYILGKRLFGEKQGIISAALSAVNLFQIRYSQEARSYSLVMLLSVISMLCFLNAVETPQKKRHWFAYAVVSAIGVYTHFFFYLVIMAQWVWFALVRPVREWKAILWTFAGFVVLTAPVNLLPFDQKSWTTQLGPAADLCLRAQVCHLLYRLWRPGFADRVCRVVLACRVRFIFRCKLRISYSH